MKIATNSAIGPALAPSRDAAVPDVLLRLRGYLASQDFRFNAKLPPERRLGEMLGVSRAELRKALSVLETEGQIWRHVGRGTFVGSRPVLNIADISYLSETTSPAQVMEARLAVEPQLSRLAALHGVEADFVRIRRCNLRCRQSRDWRSYEAWDTDLHRAIAMATRNKLLIYLFDTLNAVRQATVWGQLRPTMLPPPDHRSFDEHDAIHAAIARRDPEGAAEGMRAHLRTVRDRTLTSGDG